MRETATLSELLDDVLERIEGGVRTTRVAALIGGRVLKARGIPAEEVEQWAAGVDFECHRDICELSDRTFPLRVPLVPAHGDTRPLGYILIGPRPDGSLLSKEEQRTLVEVAEPVARAVRNVIKREQREHELAALIATHHRRIEELESKLGAGRPEGRPKLD
jgi:hypothetical protein